MIRSRYTKQKHQVLRSGSLWSWVAVGMVLVLTGFVRSAYSQFSDGKIAGTVYDSSKAAILGATLVVKDERTGVERLPHVTTHASSRDCSVFCRRAVAAVTL